MTTFPTNRVVGVFLVLLWVIGSIYSLCGIYTSEDEAAIKKKSADDQAEILAKLDAILAEKAVAKEQLVKEAGQHVTVLTQGPSDTETFRKSLHSPGDWSKRWHDATGEALAAPRATEGSQSVINFYKGCLIRHQEKAP